MADLVAMNNKQFIFLQIIQVAALVVMFVMNNIFASGNGDVIGMKTLR